MLDYGAESWKQYNEVLQDMLNRIQVRLNMNREWTVLTTLSYSGTAGWGQESNSGSKLEQEEPADSGQKLQELTEYVLYSSILFCNNMKFILIAQKSQIRDL